MDNNKDMPERIWAWTQTEDAGRWEDFKDPDMGATEYIRADLVHTTKEGE